MILAYAGMHRLGFDDRIGQVISFDIMLPAVGQGAVAIEVRESDADVLKLTAKLNDAETSSCVTAERAFLRRLEGGCQVPIGAHATVAEGYLTLDGMVGSLDGSIVYRDTSGCETDQAEDIGTRLAEMLIARGAVKLLEAARGDAAEAAV